MTDGLGRGQPHLKDHTEAPADLLRAAQDVYGLFSGVERCDVLYIVEALMAERERCAAIAERRADALSKIKGYHSEVVELRAMAAFFRSTST